MSRRKEPKTFQEKLLLLLGISAAFTLLGVLFPIVWTALIFQMVHEPYLEKRNRRRFLLLKCQHCKCPPWKSPARNHELVPGDFTSLFSKRDIIWKTFLEWDCTHCGKRSKIKEKW